MAKLPPPLSATALAIYASYEQSQRLFHSWGLSVSSLGEECDRALWYGFRHAHPPQRKEGRMLRLFNTGDREEERLLDDLRRIGVTIKNEQARVEACNGHLRGRIDGEAYGLPDAPKAVHLVEAKTHNAKNFKTLDIGVAKGKHSHHVQLQIYMHLRGYDRGLYMAQCKDTDELHCERVEYDPLFCAQLIARAERIINAARPPAKLHEDPKSKAAWACGYCPAKALCHEGAWAEHNCRTCLHSTPVEHGQWRCEITSTEITGQLLTRDMLATGCPHHLFIPDLVPGEQIDASQDANTVTYRLHDGREWVDGAGVSP